MTINNGIHKGFMLDSAAITLKSTTSASIKLPYTGALPMDSDKAYVHLHIMPVQASAALVCECGGKNQRFALDFSADEIKELLSNFFFTADGGTRHDNGLSPYMMGLWTAHFVDWKRTEAA